MRYIPVQYIDPVFRPPSEARSLILQVTNGCSWNKCTYCDMYTQPQKKFSVKPEEDVKREIEWFSQNYQGIQRVFLADGDVVALPARRLLKNQPSLNRVSSYCSPRNVTRKTDEELKALFDAGLKQVYVGAESGDDFVLKSINKGDTHQSTVDSLNRLADAGIKRSVMIINGVGGKKFSEQHALHSAELANKTQPEFLAALVLNLPHGEARFQAGYNGEFVRMNQHERFIELRQFVGALELKSTIFRSDHASNQLVLRGPHGKDKARWRKEFDIALATPERANLRAEWIRPF